MNLAIPSGEVARRKMTIIESQGDSDDDEEDLPGYVRLLRAGTEEDDILPSWFRRHLLRRHVKDMQRSLPRRLEEFRKTTLAVETDKDLKQMGLLSKRGDQKLRQMIENRPRAVERWRIPPLYIESYEALLAG